MLQKCIVAPDSFKGSMSSLAICRLTEKCVHAVFPACKVIALPVADGGEGTVDCFLEAMGGERVTLTVQGPLGDPVEAAYARIGETAIIEMAQAAGLPLVEGRADPARTSTFGVGQLMAHAIEQGATQLVLGLGGSATNDGGCGCAAALGARFLDQHGQPFVPVGGTLKEIHDVDVSPLRQKLHGCAITAMCDIENPMYGEQGAAYVYGPQKGATPELVQELDRQLRHLDKVIEEKLGISDLASRRGAGAAGAFGAGAMAFLGAELRSGIQVALDLVGFDDHLQGADAVFTGEGRIDGQSLRGKVVIGVARRAKAKSVPVYALVGDVGDGIEAVYEEGVTAIFSINQVAVPFSIARERSAMDYCATLDNMLRLMRALEEHQTGL